MVANSTVSFRCPTSGGGIDDVRPATCGWIARTPPAPAKSPVQGMTNPVSVTIHADGTDDEVLLWLRSEPLALANGDDLTAAGDANHPELLASWRLSTSLRPQSWISLFLSPPYVWVALECSENLLVCFRQP